ncbi:protein IQ-DOMAIN 3-like isoform X2 [Phragmites australis]|uniref:protein IQ-DOMAIN 3-like isoform X2 n=1 Tax=Phragmites australis TaxID=29695 RepID=UPI002D786487|nr:protein IQ-DOMAIN 3-like isoform X2 [Phragmites australis]
MEKEKRRSWFERIKRLFTSEPKQKPKPDKKAKSKRWLPGKLRTQRSFALPAPAPADQIGQAEDEQSKHAMAVALATAAAAHAAAEVVRLTCQPALAAVTACQPSSEEQAAVAIQSAYRGYLARRALRALKGLVRLQAMIRGQAVRRQTAATLRGLESLVKIQARHRSRADPNDPPPDDDALVMLRRGRELYAAAVHEQEQESKGWDSSTFSKEEMRAMMRSREEAALKRVRALQYASLQNEKIGTTRRQPIPRDEMETLNQRWSWLEEWVGSQPFDKDVPVAHQSPFRDAAAAKNQQPARARVADPLACLGAQHHADDDRLGCSARRSFVRPRRTPARGDYCYYDDAAACSPAAFPGYMASTASAMAKFRSMSTPKERFSGASDAYSEHCFQFPGRMLSPIPSMSPIPSIASDIGFTRSTRPPIAQRSPRVVKGPMTPARSRSRRSPSHHSFGSEAALHQLQMEHYTPVR